MWNYKCNYNYYVDLCFRGFSNISSTLWVFRNGVSNWILIYILGYLCFILSYSRNKYFDSNVLFTFVRFINFNKVKRNLWITTKRKCRWNDWWITEQCIYIMMFSYKKCNPKTHYFWWLHHSHQHCFVYSLNYLLLF